MRVGLTPEEFLRFTLLMAVRDGYDRVVFRPVSDYSCREFAWAAGEAVEMIPPSLDDLQAVPAELARLEPARVRWLRRLTGGRRPSGGRFAYRLGRGSVPVSYRVQWEAGRVAELEVTIGLAPELAEAAQAGLRELFPPRPEHIDY